MQPEILISRINRDMQNGGAFAPGMGKGFAHRLKQIFAKSAHFAFFHSVLRAEAKAATIRLSSGVMSSIALLA